MSEMRGDSARLHINKPGKVRRTIIGLAAVIAAIGGIMILSAGTQAVASKSNADNVTLCHATASTTNPYVVVTVDPDSIQTKIFGPNGHGTHTGPVFNPNGGKNQPAWGDIIPAFTYTQTGSDQVISYPGMNLTSDGLAILRNGCQVPPPSTPVTPTAPRATTPDCTDQVETVTPPSIAGVVWSPSGVTNLNPGQSVTYTASPAAGYVFPAGATTSWTFTNTFNPAQCPSTVTPAAPTATTPDCTNTVETVTPHSQVGVVWSPAGVTNLNVGQSVTYTASPAAGYTFTSGATTSWTFTNNFNVAQCSSTGSPSTPPPSTVSLSGSNTHKPPASHGVSPTSAHRTTHSQAGTTAAAPIPAGVSAGLNKPLANAGLKAWGTVLLLVGGASGLFAGLWPTRRRAH